MPAQTPRSPAGRSASVCGIGGRSGVPGLRIAQSQIQAAQAGRIAGMPLLRRTEFCGYFTLTGVTRNGSGTPIASCTVDVFEAHAPGDVPRWVGCTVSDGSGVFTLRVGNNATTYWARAVDPTGLLAGVTLEFAAT